MAEFNPLQASEYADAVRRLLGEDLTVGSVSPEFALNFILENNPIDWWIQHGKLPWIGRIGSALLAGNFSHVGVATKQLGLVCVVSAIIIENLTAAPLIYNIQLASGAVHDSEALLLSRDLRTAKVASSVLWTRQQVTQIGSTVSVVAVPANSCFVWHPDNDDDEFALGSIAAGGAPVFNGIAVTGSVVNQDARATFLGYERRMRTDELLAL